MRLRRAPTPFILSTATRADDLALWLVILGMCPNIEHVTTTGLRSLWRPLGQVAGLERAFRQLGLDDSWPPPDREPRLHTVSGPRAELTWALAEARAMALCVPVVAFHRRRVVDRCSTARSGER
jgi:hypothetical protein